ncbi:methyltransferase domain-containing protein [Solemya pervernicosa gill symbiont]|nr:class I SAM-dependent methyltransferase [Solemya pervernicosa gill symbiont]
MEHGRLFFETYCNQKDTKHIVEIGSQDVNGSLRSVAPKYFKYTGIDFVEGNGVDILLTDPYSIPLEDESVDFVVTSSVLEHSEFFWLLFNEMLRILKPNGLLYINAPSNGDFHRYPVDCWRFYPDSGKALENWGRKSGYSTILIESFVGKQEREYWNDFVAVFLKNDNFIANHPHRILNQITSFTNGKTHENSDFINYRGVAIFAEACFGHPSPILRRSLALSTTNRQTASTIAD